MNKREHIAELSFSKLNSLNQRIWDFGFTTETLGDLSMIAKEVRNGTTLFERIPQKQQSGLSRGSEILCAAAIICRGCPGTESENREIYRTADLIGDGRIQETLVENWARIIGCWFEDARLYLSSISQAYDMGTESTVFYDVPKRLVRKFITLKHYNVLRLALDRIIIHNAVFPSAYMKVFGFGRDEQGAFGILVFDCDCRLNVPALGCGGQWIIPTLPIRF